MTLRVKICGITTVEQGSAIATLGATALGFICVPESPRYISPAQIGSITAALPPPYPDCIGVFANASLPTIQATVARAHLTAVQLHGQESPAFCQAVRAALSQVELIKALRVRSAADLASAQTYEPYVDTLLLDAYHPTQLGGTGQTLDWEKLTQFRPARPWFLAGGLSPENVLSAIAQLAPTGIDLSSSIERSPGDKDLAKVAQLFEQLHQYE